MSKQLIYLTSLVLVLSLTSEGWPKASNPSPPDGTLLPSTWATLGWRAGEHAVSFDIYVGENYDDVKNGTGGTFRGNQSRSTSFFILGFPGYPYPNGLVPGTTYYWRIDEINDQHPDSPWVGDVWSFKIPPSTAYDPEPVDGAEFVDPNVTLSWEPGYRAKLHFVYFGDNFAEVNNASEGRPRATATYSPGLLELGKTYYWRVDEFDGRETYKGDVWRFTVGTGGPPPGGVEGIIYVDEANGNDHNNGLTPQTAFATIRKGIDAAEDGNVVLVYPGLYLEEINFLGKTITVQGVAVSPAGVPVLWNPGDFAVSFYYGEGSDSILKNFIIRDSFMGVFIADSSPTISNLTIVGNKYGIEAYADSQPDISNTILWDNTDGATVTCSDAGPGTVVSNEEAKVTFRTIRSSLIPTTATIIFAPSVVDIGLGLIYGCLTELPVPVLIPAILKLKCRMSRCPTVVGLTLAPMAAQRKPACRQANNRVLRLTRLRIHIQQTVPSVLRDISH